MATILLTGAGGRLGIMHGRALRRASRSLRLIGVDSDPRALQLAETDERCLVPKASDPDLIPVLSAIIREAGVDLVMSNIEADIEPISAARDDLGCRVFLSAHQTVVQCKNLKQQSESSDGMTAVGAAGRFSGKAIGWESVWRDGELIVAQGHVRYYGEFARDGPSGVRGVAEAGETVSDSELAPIAAAAILAIDPKPNGVFGVDIERDGDGRLRVTQIRAGRYVSGGSCHFAPYATNIAYIAIRAALGEPLGFHPPLIDPLPPGLIYVSGLDREPVITTLGHLDSFTRALSDRRDQIRPGRNDAAAG